jgi:hypothetical protein
MLSNQTPPSEIIDRIELLNRKLARFWKAAHGWAPIEAAGLGGLEQPSFAGRQGAARGALGPRTRARQQQ